MWERVELLMKEHNCRMSDVAKGSGVSYSTLTDWKAGRYRPKIEKIIAIARFFNVGVDYLLGRTDDPNFRHPKRTVYVGIPEAEQERILQEMDEKLAEYEETHSEKPTPSYDAEQIAKALELYEKYQNAIPQVQAAVETLLKSSQSEP